MVGTKKASCQKQTCICSKGLVQSNGKCKNKDSFSCRMDEQENLRTPKKQKIKDVHSAPGVKGAF